MRNFLVRRAQRGQDSDHQTLLRWLRTPLTGLVILTLTAGTLVATASAQESDPAPAEAATTTTTEAGPAADAPADADAAESTEEVVETPAFDPLCDAWIDASGALNTVMVGTEIGTVTAIRAFIESPEVAPLTERLEAELTASAAPPGLFWLFDQLNNADATAQELQDAYVSLVEYLDPACRNAAPDFIDLDGERFKITGGCVDESGIGAQAHHYVLNGFSRLAVMTLLSDENGIPRVFVETGDQLYETSQLDTEAGVATFELDDVTAGSFDVVIDIDSTELGNCEDLAVCAAIVGAQSALGDLVDALDVISAATDAVSYPEFGALEEDLGYLGMRLPFCGADALDPEDVPVADEEATADVPVAEPGTDDAVATEPGAEEPAPDAVEDEAVAAPEEPLAPEAPAADVPVLDTPSVDAPPADAPTEDPAVDAPVVSESPTEAESVSDEFALARGLFLDGVELTVASGCVVRAGEAYQLALTDASGGDLTLFIDTVAVQPYVLVGADGPVFSQGAQSFSAASGLIAGTATMDGGAMLKFWIDEPVGACGATA